MRSAWVVLLACLGCAVPQRRPEDRPQIRLLAETLDGAPVVIGGPGAVRLVDVWASWCGPCQATMPRAAAVVRSRAAEGVEEIALSVDDTLKAARRYVAGNAVEGQVLHYRGGMATAQRDGLTGIPLFFVVDRKGRIVGAVRGASAGLERLLNDALDEALATPPAPAPASGAAEARP